MRVDGAAGGAGASGPKPLPLPAHQPHIRLIFIIVFHFEAICDKIIQFLYPYYLIMFLISSLFFKIRSPYPTLRFVFFAFHDQNACSRTLVS